MEHKCSIQPLSGTTPTVSEKVFKSDIGGAIEWEVIAPGHCRGKHPAFVAGKVFIIPYVIPFNASTEVFVSAMDSNVLGVNHIDVCVYDASGTPVGEYVVNLDLFIVQ